MAPVCCRLLIGGEFLGESKFSEQIEPLIKILCYQPDQSLHQRNELAARAMPAGLRGRDVALANGALR